MASASVLTLFIFSIFFIDHLSLANSSTQSKIHSTKETVRIRRQACEYGTYNHTGKSCCKCAPGQQVKEHCSVNPDDGTCEHCDTGTYSAEPNDEKSCLPCTSCVHANANLEVALPCTTARNAVCRCKKDHYCGDNGGSCQTCSRCTICPHGVKKACTATSDAVCKPEPEAIDSTPIIIIIVIIIFAVIAIALGIYFWRRKQQGNRGPGSSGGGGQETQPLNDIPKVSSEDLEPLLSDIAEELGWSVMREVARKSGIKETIIENCMNDHPQNNQEQTHQLLKALVQKYGKGTPRKLVEILDKCGKRGTAEKVIDILSRTSPV